jgi:hypothetical protein
MNLNIVKPNAAWDDNKPPEWLDRIDFDKMEKMASIGFTPEKIAMYFNVKKIEFMYYFMLDGSELKYHYDRGILFYQVKDGMAMIDASNSNSNQAQRLDRLRDVVNFRNAVEEIIYGGL